MSATITNIADAPSKRASEVEAFRGYPDSHLQTRLTMLDMVLEGRIDTENKTQILSAVFPKGYDPVNHPEDNRAAVYREGLRRGVFSESPSNS